MGTIKLFLRNISTHWVTRSLWQRANIEYKEDSRNKPVAMKIGRIAYYLLKSGRPDTDFTTLIYLHSTNGADVGDINHSYRFPPQFLKHVSKVVEDHVKLRWWLTRPLGST